MRLSIPPVLRANQAVLFLCVATALLTTGQGIAVAIVPLYADTLGMTAAQVGLMVSAFGLARFLTNMPSAILSDRVGRRAVLVAGALVSAVGNVLSGYADALAPLLVFRFVAGIGSAAFITATVVYIADVSQPATRGRLMSLYQGSFLVGITIGPALGGLIAEVFGIRAPFFAIGIVSLISAAWALLRVPESRWIATHTQRRGAGARPAPQANAPVAVAAHPVRKERAWSFFLQRDFLLISLTFAGTFFTRGGALFTLLPLKASNELMLSEGQVGLLLTLPSVFTFLMLPFVGVFTDRHGRKSTIVPGVLLFGVALLVLGVSPDIVFFGVGMALYGISQGLEGPAPLAYVSDISPPERQAVAQGAARSLGDLALLTAPPIMGLAADLAGTTPTLLANGALMVVVGLVFWAFASDPARQAAKERRAGAAARS
jgi:MFS family permease